MNTQYRRYCRLAIMTALMTLFVICPIYGADGVTDEDASNIYVDAATLSATPQNEISQNTDSEAVVEQLELSSEDLKNEQDAVAGGEGQVDGSEEETQYQDDELVVEKVTADQIELVTDESGVEQWGLGSIQNEDQQQYCYFYAYFKKSGDDIVYKLYFTGFQYDGPKSPYPIEGFRQLIKDMAAAFLNGETFDIYDGNKFKNTYGFVFNPIDAEKASVSSDTKGEAGTADYPVGDVDLCWAATASNMIQFSSWTTFSNEDYIFSHFKDNCSDYTSSTETGVKWFFNGVNTRQTVDENGNVIYDAYSAESISQQKTADTTKYCEAIAAENIIQSYWLEYYSKEEAFKKLMEALNNYNSVGLSITFYDDNGVRVGGHAITCFGYIYNCTYGSVVALFTTDSDDFASRQYVDPADEEDVRINKINCMTMHPFNYTMYSNGMMTVSLVGYDYNRLDVINIMASYPNRGSLDIESDGTMDINNDCDIIISDLYLVDATTNEIFGYDSTEDEDEVGIIVYLANRSYAPVNSGNGAYVKVRIMIYAGDTLIDTVTEWLCFKSGDNSNPLTVIVYNLPYTLPAYVAKSDEYFRMTGEILYVIDYSDGETPITEAYTSNNKSAYEPVIKCYVKGLGGDVIEDIDIIGSDSVITDVVDVAGNDAVTSVKTSDNMYNLYCLVVYMALLILVSAGMYVCIKKSNND